MSVLSWDKPKRKMPLEEWQKISADGAPPGVYTPNMSREDELKWKAKLIKGADPRVEIRKTAGSRMLIIVRDGSVRMSMNGPAELSDEDWRDLVLAQEEAYYALKEVRS